MEELADNWLHQFHMVFVSCWEWGNVSPKADGTTVIGDGGYGGASCKVSFVGNNL